jgi:hypothetical protein
MRVTKAGLQRPAISRGAANIRSLSRMTGSNSTGTGTRPTPSTFPSTLPFLTTAAMYLNRRVYLASALLLVRRYSPHLPVPFFEFDFFFPILLFLRTPEFITRLLRVV